MIAITLMDGLHHKIANVEWPITHYTVSYPENAQAPTIFTRTGERLNDTAVFRQSGGPRLPNNWWGCPDQDRPKVFRPLNMGIGDIK